MSSTTAFSSSPFGRVDGAFFVACSLLASGAISAGEAGARVGSCFRATAVAEERIVVERRSEERGAREVSQKERKRATDVSRERERRAESSERRGFRTTFPPPFLSLSLAKSKKENARALQNEGRRHSSSPQKQQQPPCSVYAALAEHAAPRLRRRAREPARPPPVARRRNYARHGAPAGHPRCVLFLSTRFNDQRG